LAIQILTVSVVALVATVGVYGIVALIVRMDDAGHRLIKYSNEKGWLSTLGSLLVKSLPIVIKSLAVIGTIALLLVSVGIFVHTINYFHHVLPAVPSIIKELALGVAGGLIAVATVSVGKRIVGFFKKR